MYAPFWAVLPSASREDLGIDTSLETSCSFIMTRTMAFTSGICMTKPAGVGGRDVGNQMDSSHCVDAAVRRHTRV